MQSMLATVSAPLWITAVMAVFAAALWPVYRRSARPGRSDVFFGVTVQAEWPDSPAGRAVAAAYRRRIDLASAAAIGLAVLGGVSAVPARAGGWLGLGGFGQSLASVAAYLAGRRAVFPFGRPTATVREASLEPDRSNAGRRWLLGQSGPLAVMAVSAALLAVRYPTLPDHVPVQVDGTGHVERWADKSVGAVAAIPLVGLLTVAFVGGIGWATIHGGRRLREAGRDDRHLRAVLWLLMAGDYFTAVVTSAVGWIPASAGTRWGWVPFGVTIAATLGLAAVLVYFAARVWPAVRPAAGGDGTPDRCWRWGLFYINPADAAVLVPKRFGFGYTLNLARGGTWALAIGVLAYLAAALAVPLLMLPPRR